MATVPENLEKILQARYGEEVRGAIHDSISGMYTDYNIDVFDQVKSMLDKGLDAQYLDSSTAVPNSYWQGAGRYGTANGYNRYIPVKLSAGQYFLTNVSEPFTFVKSGASTVKLNEHEGYTGDESDPLKGTLVLSNDSYIYYTSIGGRGGITNNGTLLFSEGIAKYYDWEDKAANNFEVQYLDSSTAVPNSYWQGAGRYGTANGYNRYIPVILLPGSYYLVNVSPVFTFIKVGSSTIKLSDYQKYYGSEQKATLVIDEDSTIYATSMSNNGLILNHYQKAIRFYPKGYHGFKLTEEAHDNELVQYLDTSTVTLNSYWTSAGRYENADGYNRYIPVILLPGSYYLVNVSPVFTFIKVGSSTIKLSDYQKYYGSEQKATLVIDEDSTIYATSMSNNGLIVDYHVDEKTIKVGPNSVIHSLTTAVDIGMLGYDNTVILEPTVFNLVDEYGQSYLDSYSKEEPFGLFLGNRIKLIGSPQSKIVFDYEGTNTRVHSYFSPINMKFNSEGFTLEGISIESKNCRYSVHDEDAGYETPYKNVYRSCVFKHDSSECSWGAHQAIGGGLGKTGLIVIEDGYFESVGCSDTISYHNPVRTDIDTKSTVIIKDAYLSGTTLCANYGRSSLKSKMMVSNCSLGSEPKLERVITEDRYDNMELISWNNEIRQ